MAPRNPLIGLKDVTLGYGGNPLLDAVNLAVHEGDRLALVGRNGCGKSTLLRLLAGLVTPDKGEYTRTKGVRTAYLEQDPDFTASATLGDFARAGLPEGQEYRIDMVSAGLKFDPYQTSARASGGERRRAALAKVLTEDADILLLDEPTNHLDIEAIEWLETYLNQEASAFILISHDRAFLNRLTRHTLWLDRGELRRAEVGFGGFEAWRDTLWAEEDLARHKLNRKIKAEARWAVEGISARRKRNQGRVRALADLRAQKAAQIKRQGTAAMQFQSTQKSGRKVLSAKEISKSFGGQKIIDTLSLTIQRGDRIAFVGANGVGKTTLLKMLLGQEAPDSGKIEQGTQLELCYFDQNRAQLDPNMTLWESLTGDKDLRVGGKADQVMVRGQPRHVVGYLKDFLFTDDQARAPVSSLSGGEKARLLLAKLMAMPSNLLVLDEPTNDLDIESLDLLQELLADYDGTVLLVSHDRDFIDRVAGQTLAFEGQGKCTLFAGGWSDYQTQKALSQTRPKPTLAEAPKSKATPAAPKPDKSKPQGTGLSFTQKHRLAELPDEIERLEAEIAKLSTVLSDPDLFTKEPAKFAKATQMIQDRQSLLSAAEEEWLTLEELAQES